MLCKENNIKLTKTSVAQLGHQARNALCKKYNFTKFADFPRLPDGKADIQSLLSSFLKTHPTYTFEQAQQSFEFDGMVVTQEMFNKSKAIVRSLATNGINAPRHRAKFSKPKSTSKPKPPIDNFKVSTDQNGHTTDDLKIVPLTRPNCENVYIDVEKKLDEIFLQVSMLADTDIVEDIRSLRRKIIQKSLMTSN